MAAPSITRQPVKTSPLRLITAGVVAAVVALGLNIAIRLIAGTFIAIDPEFRPLSWMGLTMFSLFPVVLHTAAYALAERYTRNVQRTYLIAAAGILLMMLSMPAMMLVSPLYPGTNPTTLGIAALLHLVTAGAAVWSFLTQARAR